MGLEIHAQINAVSKLFSISPAQYNQLTDLILADGRVLWGWRYTGRLLLRPSFSLVQLPVYRDGILGHQFNKRLKLFFTPFY